jgi:hypothetical protein
MTTVRYTPRTGRGERYRNIGYWFATGWWFAQDRSEFVPDRSQEFADLCAQRADAYELESTHHLASIPDLWAEFREEHA